MGSSLENMEIYKVGTRWHGGAVTPLPAGLDTFWRDLPFAVILYLEGADGELEFENGRRCQLPVGCAGIIPPRLPHRLFLAKGSKSTWAHIEVLLFDAIDAFRLFDLPPVVSGKEAKNLGKLCRQRAIASESHPILHQLRQQSLEADLAATVLALGRACNQTEYDWKRLARLYPLLRFMEANLKKPLTRNELAQRLHLSPEWFHQIFSETMKEAPMAYLLRMRLEKACRLLLGTPLSISEIAGEVGFPDPLYFSRIFKLKLGSSPRDYRRLHANPF